MKNRHIPNLIIWLTEHLSNYLINFGDILFAIKLASTHVYTATTGEGLKYDLSYQFTAMNVSLLVKMDVSAELSGLSQNTAPVVHSIAGVENHWIIEI